MGKLDNAKFLIGDVFDKLGEIPDESVHTVITSPPYWRLRDYGEKNQIGLEESPQDYIDKMTSVFDKIWEVLHESGTVWLVIDDTYYGGGEPGYASEGSKQYTNKGSMGGKSKKSGNDGYLKPKDLCMIPQRLAVSLQKQGWWVRNQIIWYKTAAMPESVKDRLTRSYESIYLLTKSKDYYYDHEAIKVKSSKDSHGGGKPNRNRYSFQSGRDDGNQGLGILTDKRNKRDVWQVNNSGFGDAHFAVFPLELIEPCVKAGSSKYGVCQNCSSPYIRKEDGKSWKSSCDCDTEKTEPSTVLDPFVGSGTTGIVALKHDRQFIGIDLNDEYIKMAKNRIKEHKEVPVLHDWW